MNKTDARRMFGELPKPGETRRYRIVPEPVAAERVFGDDSDIKQSIGEQMIEGLTEFVEALETEVSEKPKVWLCCSDTERFHIARGDARPVPFRGAYSGDVYKFRIPSGSKLTATNINAETASLIHPAHNLKPGECCEVPAREDVQLQSALEFIHKVGEALHNRRSADWFPEAANNAANDMSEAMRVIGNECLEFDISSADTLTAPAPEVPARETNQSVEFTTLHEAVQKTSDALGLLRGSGMVWKFALRLTDELQVPVPKGTESAPVAPPVAEEGPQHPISLPAAVLISEFIQSNGEFDFYVASSCGEEGLWQQGSSIFKSGFHSLGHILYWKRTNPSGSLAALVIPAYDAALAANKLPPHPRHPKPEGAEVFLGWWQDSDYWWGHKNHHGETVAALIRSIKDETDHGWVPFQSANGTGYVMAFNRAKELGLPDRDARKAKLADLDRQIAALTEERDKLQEVV